jgi:putative thioredoxin
MAVDVVDRAGFEREVVQGSSDKPVVVDFWAPWCQPCLVLGPVLEKLHAGDGGRWKLVKVDVQAHPELAEPLGVQGIPAVFAFRGGEVVDQFTGSQPPAQVRRWLDRLVPSPADEAVASAELARTRGDLELARAELERALTLRSDHPGALLGLAELDPDRTDEIVGRLPPSLPPALAQRRARLAFAAEARRAAPASELDQRWVHAHALAADGDLERAAQELLDLVRRDRKYRDDGARKALLSLFELAGPESDLTSRYRRELGRLLF